eukprot:g9174.t1
MRLRVVRRCISFVCALLACAADPPPPDEDPRNDRFRDKYEYCQEWTASMDQALSLKIMSLEKEVYEVRKLLHDFALIEEEKNREYMQTLHTHASSIEGVRQGIFDRLERERLPFALEQKLAELTASASSSHSGLVSSSTAPAAAAPRLCPAGSYLMRLGSQFSYCTSARWNEDVNVKNYGHEILDCDHAQRLPSGYATYVFIRSGFTSIAQCVLHAVLVAGHMVTLQIAGNDERVLANLDAQVRLNEGSEMLGALGAEEVGVGVGNQSSEQKPRSLRDALAVVKDQRSGGGEDEIFTAGRSGPTSTEGRTIEDKAAQAIRAGRHREALEHFVWNPTQFIQGEVFAAAQSRLHAPLGQSHAPPTSETTTSESEKESKAPDAAFVYLVPRLLYLQHFGDALAQKFFPVQCQEVFLDSCDPRPRAPLGYVRQIRLKHKWKYFERGGGARKNGVNATSTKDFHLDGVRAENLSGAADAEDDDIAVLFAVHGVGYSVFPTREAFEALVLEPWTRIDFVAWCHGGSLGT